MAIEEELIKRHYKDSLRPKSTTADQNPKRKLRPPVGRPAQPAKLRASTTAAARMLSRAAKMPPGKSPATRSCASLLLRTQHHLKRKPCRSAGTASFSSGPQSIWCEVLFASFRSGFRHKPVTTTTTPGEEMCARWLNRQLMYGIQALTRNVNGVLF